MTRIKTLTYLVSLLSMMAAASIVWSGDAVAQNIGPATGGESISADSATTSGTVQGLGFVTLTGPSIRETSTGQLQSGNTIVITAPTGFEFNTGFDTSDLDDDGGNTDMTINAIGANNTDLAIGNISVNASEISVEITSSSTSAGRGKGPAHIQFDSIQVRPTTGVLPNQGTLKYNGTADLGGIDNLGSLEMVAGARTKIRVETRNDGTGSIVPSQSIIAGQSKTVYAIARDQFDNFISNFNVGSDGWKLTDLTGGVSQSALIPNSTARQATFTPESTGSARIMATDDTVDSVKSGTFTVNPAAADHMVITRQPPDTSEAGAVLTPAVQLELRDRFDNVVDHDDNLDITASATDGSNLLLGTTTVTPQNGIITFDNLSIEQALTTTLRFEASGIPDVTSDTVTIQPSDPADLTYIRQPSNTQKGDFISPAVKLQLQDEFGNNVDSAKVDISVSQVDSTGNLQSDLTESTDQNGIAVFDKIKIDLQSASGPIRIEAAIDGVSMTAVVSDEFEILDPGDLARFEISDTNGNPIGDQTAGQSFDIQITAIAANGDTVESYEDHVNINSSGTLNEGGGGTSDFSNGILSAHSVTLTSGGENELIATHPNNDNITGRDTLTVLPANLDTDSTVVTADPSSIDADGNSTSQISVQLRDVYGNNLITGGEDISLAATNGQLSNGNTTADSVAAIDNSDGTYSADLQSTTDIQTSRIRVYRSGTLIDNQQTVQFTAGPPSALLIKASDSTTIGQQVAGSAFMVDVWVVDENNNPVDNVDGTLDFSSNINSIDSGQSSPISNGYLDDHAITINEANESVSLTVSEQGTGYSDQSNSFEITAAAPDTAKSMVEASPGIIHYAEDGGDQSTITVTLRDTFNNRIYRDHDVRLTIENPDGSAPDATLDTNDPPFSTQDGTYTATLTSSSTVEDIIVTGTFNGPSGPQISQTDTIRIVVPNTWRGVGERFTDADDWSAGSNWSLGTVPTKDDFVIIPTDLEGESYPVVDEDINAGTLTIEDGANITVSSSQVVTITSDLIVNGSFDFTEPSDLLVDGSMSGTGSYLANGFQKTTVKGDISVNSFLSSSTGADLQLKGNSQQAISSNTMRGRNVQVDSDVFLRKDIILDSLNISDNGSLTMSSRDKLSMDVVKLSGNGTLDLDNDTLIIRGDIDVQNMDASKGTIKFQDTSQQVIEHFQTVKNLHIDNPAGVKVFPTNHLTVSGQLQLNQGRFIIPSGVNLIANNKQVNGGTMEIRRNITNGGGWRLLASPIATIYKDLMDGSVSQGYSGSSLGMIDADGDSLQPNILYYREDTAGTDNQHWRAPDDASASIPSGKGVFIYFFGDIPGDARYNNPLPDTLSVEGTSGAEFDGVSSFDFNVSYTADADTADSAGTGWNLVGNPYAATIDWDEEGDWTKTNMDNVIYVWSSVDSTYKTWNGSTGSLGSGKIAPYQGFWVKARKNPTLQVDQEAKTNGRVFQQKESRKQSAPHVALHLAQGQDTSELHFSFMEKGSMLKDRYDAYHLNAFGAVSHPPIYSLLPDGNKLSINNLPLHFGSSIEIPVGIGNMDYNQSSNNYTINIKEKSGIPEHWTFSLKDRSTGKKVKLSKTSQYQFTIDTDRNKQRKSKSQYTERDAASKDLQMPMHPLQSTKVRKKKNTRFSLIITPGASNGDVPDEFALYDNYPNPFNPTTTIAYDVPVESQVRLEVYNILGRRVATLVNRRLRAGHHETEWNASRLASGVYIYRLRAGNKRFTKKMMLVK